MVNILLCKIYFSSRQIISKTSTLKFYFILYTEFFKKKFKSCLWQFLKKLSIELPYDLAFLLLGIYPKELKTSTQKNMYMTVDGSIIQNNQKAEATQRPSVDELINKSDLSVQ